MGITKSKAKLPRILAVRHLWRWSAAIFLFGAGGPSAALANTGTVFGPGIDPGDRSVEYRASYVPSEGQRADRLRQRVHYQQAFSDRLRGRVIAAFDDTSGSGSDYAYTRLELLWHYREGAVWGQGLRFELQGGRDSPDRVRFIWSGSRNFGAGWQFRTNAVVGRQTGAGAASGLQLETRFQATYRLSDRARLGVEMFNNLNTTADGGKFDEQKHQLGPVLKADIGEHWSLLAGCLGGISDAASNANWRLMFGRGVGTR